MTPPKETSKTSIADTEVMKLYELSDKEFRIIPLKKFSEMKTQAYKKRKSLS